MTEAAFTTELLKWLKVYKWRSFHVRNSGYGGNTYVQGEPGFPDIVAIRPPRLLVAELKIGKAGTLLGEPRPEQRMWLAALERVGAEVHVWHPADLPRIVEILR
jgi:hypothetical protein